MRSVYVQCTQAPDFDLTATLNGDTMIAISGKGKGETVEMCTKSDIDRLAQKINRSINNPNGKAPRLHDALLIRAFCILTDNSGEYPLEGTGQHLVTYTYGVYTYRYKETRDESV